MANVIERHISEILRPYPQVRTITKQSYQFTMYYIGKVKYLFHQGTPDLVQAQALSDQKHHCFFGYYNQCPWDNSGRYIVYLKVPFAKRMPKPGESAEICLVDLNNDSGPETIAETKAWCWQQGCMLQWLEDSSGQNIIFNGFQGGEYVSVVSDLYGKIKMVLPLPIYAVSKDGKKAMSLNFSRLHYSSPGYGYTAKPYTMITSPVPENDGIWHMDIKTGKYKLIISLKQIVRDYWVKEFENGSHYFNHLEFNPSGTRFVFFHRWFKRGKRNSRGQDFTRMFTANPDGSDLYLLADHGMVSHFTWKDDIHLLAWAKHPSAGCRYYLFEDQAETVKIVGEGSLTEDGHPTYSPDGRWILTDTYPNAERMRTLILFDTVSSKRIDLGRYLAPFVFDGQIRCDLHPRWSRDGKSVCFDSVHEGMRAVYAVSVEELIS